MSAIHEQFYKDVKDAADEFDPYCDEEPNFEEMFFSMFNEENEKNRQWFYKNEHKIGEVFWKRVCKLGKDAADIQATRKMLAETMHSY